MTERDVATDWADRVLTSAHGHYRAAVRYARLQSWLGIPTVLFTTIVGTSVFASLQSRPDPWWQIIVGLLSIAAAVLSALQAFLNYSEKAEKHRVAGACYNSVRRELQQLLAQDREWKCLSDIRRRIDDLARDSPHIPESVLSEMRRHTARIAPSQQGECHAVQPYTGADRE